MFRPFLPTMRRYPPAPAEYLGPLEREGGFAIFRQTPNGE
jgi:hypothetical protein